MFVLHRLSRGATHYIYFFFHYQINPLISGERKRAHSGNSRTQSKELLVILSPFFNMSLFCPIVLFGIILLSSVNNSRKSANDEPMQEKNFYGTIDQLKMNEPEL